MMEKIKKYKKICWVPIYGPIIYLWIIIHELKKNDKFNGKKNASYMFLMGLLGTIGMFIGICFFALIFRALDLDVSGKEYEKLAVISCLLSAVFFLWPMMTLGVFKYAKEAQKMLQDNNE